LNLGHGDRHGRVIGGDWPVDVFKLGNRLQLTFLKFL
jgi:hypothetical protein